MKNESRGEENQKVESEEGGGKSKVERKAKFRKSGVYIGRKGGGRRLKIEFKMYRLSFFNLNLKCANMSHHNDIIYNI